MVPMAMREHRSIDVAKIDPQPRAVVFDSEFHRAGIEEYCMALSAPERFDDERQSVVGAALALTGQLPHAGSHQCRPFEGYIGVEPWTGCP